jgi:hypothetical protein
MFTAAFLSVVPNKLGGILTTSTRVDIENNCAVFFEFQFMNLWVIHAQIPKDLGNFSNNR